MRKEIEASGIRVLGVSLEGDPGKVAAVARQRQYWWEQGYVEPENRARVAQDFQLDSLPSIQMVDAEGHVTGRNLEGEFLKRIVLRNPAQK
jgi:hypothetical protein